MLLHTGFINEIVLWIEQEHRSDEHYWLDSMDASDWHILAIFRNVRLQKVTS